MVIYQDFALLLKYDVDYKLMQADSGKLIPDLFREQYYSL